MRGQMQDEKLRNQYITIKNSLKRYVKEPREKGPTIYPRLRTILR
uniref:GH08923p n=1 Tax=Drosophila melanogaster TaxID=7227 RepID=Q95NS4_DROME|nr:GH08923p [Drosophila melanogaster]AAL28676.1 LD11130p [Drosophila melanogaster]